MKWVPDTSSCGFEPSAKATSADHAQIIGKFLISTLVEKALVLRSCWE